jgi:hypothetical protein
MTVKEVSQITGVRTTIIRDIMKNHLKGECKKDRIFYDLTEKNLDKIKRVIENRKHERFYHSCFICNDDFLKDGYMKVTVKGEKRVVCKRCFVIENEKNDPFGRDAYMMRRIERRLELLENNNLKLFKYTSLTCNGRSCMNYE